MGVGQRALFPVVVSSDLLLTTYPVLVCLTPNE